MEHTRAIDSTKLQRELGWESSLQFEEGLLGTLIIRGGEAAFLMYHNLKP